MRTVDLVLGEINGGNITVWRGAWCAGGRRQMGRGHACMHAHEARCDTGRGSLGVGLVVMVHHKHGVFRGDARGGGHHVANAVGAAPRREEVGQRSADHLLVYMQENSECICGST